MSGATIWITGLSGSGKTTLARLVAAALRQRGQRVEVIDGDDDLPLLFDRPARTPAERDADLRRIGFVCNALSKHGVYAIAAAVAPLRGVRDAVRAAADGRFFEVYLATPLEACAARDVKGWYTRASAGELPHFPGVSGPYEPPLAPELTLLTDAEPPEVSAARIVTALEGHGFLAGDLASDAAQQ